MGEDEECDCPLAKACYGYESDRTCEGSIADWYYELKEQREDRKRQKIRMKEEAQKRLKEDEEERAWHIRLEEEQEAKVRALYRQALKDEWAKDRENWRPPSKKELLGNYDLYSAEYSRHHYNTIDPVKTLFFWYELEGRSKKRKKSKRKLIGKLHLGRTVGAITTPFRPPKRMAQVSTELVTEAEKREIQISFACHGVLKVRVTSAFPARRFKSRLPNVSETFELFGILGSHELAKELRQERAKGEKDRREAKRPPSPRESWFEMNHPMGAWAQGDFF